MLVAVEISSPMTEGRSLHATVLELLDEPCRDLGLSELAARRARTEPVATYGDP
jgi:hypothetical protein